MTELATIKCKAFKKRQQTNLSWKPQSVGDLIDNGLEEQEISIKLAKESLNCLHFHLLMQCKYLDIVHGAYFSTELLQNMRLR